jgi:hypothetical protein
MRSLSFIGRSIFTATVLATVVFGMSCTTAETKTSAETAKSIGSEPLKPNESGPKVSTIEIAPNGPADTVRAFYMKLRENRIREAIYLTNLRPAIEGLSDDELKEFSVDFEKIAKKVPAELQINGEIISGDEATVTASLPNEDDKFEVQQIKLKKNGEFWTILTVDEAAEAKIKQEGKNYLRALKIENHQEEAKTMLERIAKAQMVHAAQNQGKFGDLAKLVEMRIVPEDVKTSESTGYSYTIVLLNDGVSYYGTATPAEYKKTGVNSYILVPSEKGMPVVTGRDNGGKLMKK